MNRRGFITGLTGLIAAPTIVRATSLMRVKALAGAVPAAYRVSPETPRWLRVMAVVTAAPSAGFVEMQAFDGQSWRRLTDAENDAAVWSFAGRSAAVTLNVGDYVALPLTTTPNP